jgi:hypothetical protein
MLRLACCLFAAIAAYAAAPLYQTSFDKPNSGWIVASGMGVPDGAVTHGAGKSLRVEPGAGGQEAAVHSAPLALTIGKRYQVSGWVRTENLTVRDAGRSPIAIGAALRMASMPFDVHSAALGGTRPWTRLTLDFVATRAQDEIVLEAGAGGALQGKAWFAGVALDEISASGAWPAREAVETFGPAYRYAAAGWIYLHIEGQPYDRGYQHGHLMAKEIPEYLARCAADLGSAENWSQYRTYASALFLRGFDKEILEEMRGIADGASDAGAKWQNRRIDLVDVAVANVTVEMGELNGAVRVTPTGIEGLRFDKPAYAPKPDSPLEHCSAFAATGPATRDGKMVIGHVTWWPLTLAEQTNVMLDIQPAGGHRVLMQSYPGGIESGTDWYQNDAGMVLTETTIQQTPFNQQGTPVAFRARMAIQYGGNIDEMVERLGTHNNGLYTNEWLMGDAKNNEIAMYELGTNHTRLWRSSKGQWFGDTLGFYWGDNNDKDLSIRLEYHPDPQGEPDYVPYRPGPRDLAWQDLYRKYRGRIDEQFAFLAFRSAPLVSGSTMDAKVTTADMASRSMVWAAFGKPNQREWVARPGGYAKNDGLFPNGYYLFAGAPSESLLTAVRENETARLAVLGGKKAAAKAARNPYKDRLWKGWILPASDADTWFAAGSAAYYRVLRSDDVARAMEAQRIAYRGLKLAPAGPLTEFRMQQAKGALWLDALRGKMGDEAFFALMRDFFAAHTGQTVTSAAFLQQAGTAFDFAEPPDGPAYLTGDISSRLASAILVYGTVREAGANRYAAEQLQTRFLDRYESAVPIYKDFEAGDELLRAHDVIFVGRPEANSALAAWSGGLGLEYAGAEFRIDGEWHTGWRDGLVFAARNPLDPARMVLVYAGNDALATVKTIAAGGETPSVVVEDGNVHEAARRR